MTVENIEEKPSNSFGFKFAIFNQTIKESIKNTFGIKKQNKGIVSPADKEVDDAINKVGNLKKFIETTHKSIKKIIKDMEETAEAEQTMTTLFFEESYKECKNDDLNMRYTNIGESFKKDIKELNKYINSLKFFEEWLDTFLNKAIKDTQDTINLCNQVRIEIQTYTNCLYDAKESLKIEKPGYLEYERVKKIADESEDLLEKSKVRYEQLKIQLTEKVNMLELKRQVDLPNYLDSVQSAFRLYHQSISTLYSPPTSLAPSPLSSPSQLRLPSPSQSPLPSSLPSQSPLPSSLPSSY
ncbi:hypothetical protein PIROE2DRAFT_17496 [Piromyces sp. E2]|nr:hypothetical protein PIROE2DRAFT_17496 [Piromyces sp. E2]|eukprot:OUM57508.1 hypothetical protein PIROE2DRAFT_17496 [Piromyces sp. E2]